MEAQLEEISQRTYMHICIAHGDRQRCGEGGGGNGWSRAKGGKWGSNVIVSTIKKFKKTNKKPYSTHVKDEFYCM